MYGENGHFQYSKGNNCKSRKTRVMVHVFCMASQGVNICVKFHENMSSCFKVMEKTQKLLRDTHTHKKKENYKVGKPELRFLCSACRLIVFNVCVKYHENVPSGFKVMERTRKLFTHKGQ